MARFDNKVALVTGGGTGIGRAAAVALANEGAKVVVTGRREEPLKSLAQEHANIDYVTADVAAAGGPGKAIAFTIDKHDRLDVLVNNAGVGILGPLVELSDEQINQLFAVNTTGALITAREAIPQLAKTKGSIVNITSTVAQASLPGAAAYAGTKAALERITASLAVELGPMGVRVNAVAPGLTESDMSSSAPKEMLEAMVAQTPLGRIGKPQDIAQAVAFLASEDAGWITGQCLQSSGGLML